MKYIYGPIPSRRLGQSLGVDPIPLKTCNWNCIYCQLGRSVPLVNERAEYAPCADILAELRQALEAHKPGEIDHVSFVGSGEPTLHSGLGRMIRAVKKMTAIPVAVITNGALLWRADVRDDLLAADIVMPTLDAGGEALYKTIHRPHPDLTYRRVVAGLEQFRREYSGKLWVEVMLIQGVNDGEDALRELAAALRRIGPDEVHLVLPTRPPAETWVAPPEEGALLRAEAILGGIARLVHPHSGDFDLSGYEGVVEAALAIIQRHPMSQEQLEQALHRWAPSQVQEALAALAADGRAHPVDYLGAAFWSAGDALFPDAAHSLAARPRFIKEVALDEETL